MNLLFVCLFVWSFSSHSKIFTHMETSPLPMKSCKFDLCSALMAIEQWELFNVPHLLRHGPSVYNGHLRGAVTLTPNAERLPVELSLPVFTTVCHERGSNPDPRPMLMYLQNKIKCPFWWPMLGTYYHWAVRVI